MIYLQLRAVWSLITGKISRNTPIYVVTVVIVVCVRQVVVLQW